jgi:hypothetical protein
MSRLRPRGFVPYAPRQSAQDLISQIQVVIALYDFAITIRQIFYRLVATVGYGKTEKAYNNLGEVIARARRGNLIPMDAIRDDGFVQKMPQSFRCAEDFKGRIVRVAELMRLERQGGQKVRLAVWCEAGGMVPQLELVASEYGIPVLSSGGFDSITAKHSMAREFAEMGNVAVLHLGDYDPSGVHMFSSLEQDIQAFAYAYDGDVSFTRLAVLPEHIEEMGLPTAPPKKTDNRSFDGDETVQCEAIAPDVLNEILRDAIESRMDMDVYNDVLEREVQTQDALVEELESIGWTP